MDQDTLPPYEILDRILEGYLEDDLSVDQLVGQGLDRDTVEWVARTVRQNEYKRRQSAPGIKVTGKAFGGGRRMPIADTRAMISAALSGALDAIEYRRDPVFNVEVPATCPGVPDAALTPRATWNDPAAYDAQAARLAGMFVENFRTFEGSADAGLRAAGPGPGGHDQGRGGVAHCPSSLGGATDTRLGPYPVAAHPARAVSPDQPHSRKYATPRSGWSTNTPSTPASRMTCHSAS